MFRKRLAEILSKGKDGDIVSIAYDIVMFVTIVVSVIPLTVHREYPWYYITESVTVGIFIFDYILRWITADVSMKKGVASFFLYPLSPMAIIDLLSILPGIGLISSNFKLFRLTRLFRILRIFKLLRYSNKSTLFLKILKKEKGVLLSVLLVSLFYIFVTALIMYNTEPHINPVTGDIIFKSFFDALYWATVTLTTVGYGDLCPATDIGRLISMVSSIMGIAIIALPSSIITASYLDEIRKKDDETSSYRENDKDKSIPEGVRDDRYRE